MKDNIKAMMKFMQDEHKAERDNELIEEVKNDKAFLSNDLIRGMFEKKTITSLKLLLYIARVGLANNKVLKDSYYSIMLDIDDVCRYTNTLKDTLKSALVTLQETSITYFSTDKKRKLGLKTRVSLMPRIEDISKNVLKVDMHSDILNMIKETSNFTAIENLKDIMQIKRPNSIRMLLLLSMIKTYTHQNKKYSLAQLNFLFDTNYARWAEFERKILKPVKAELDINSSLSFKYTKNEDYKRIGLGRKPIENVTIIPIEVNSLFSLDNVDLTDNSIDIAEVIDACDEYIEEQRMMESD